MAPNGKTTLDTVTIQDSAVKNGKPASDTLTITDKSRPDNTGKDTVALSDSASVQTNVFHPVAATDTVAIKDGPALDRTAKDTLAVADRNKLDSTSKDAVSLSDSTSGQSAVFHPVAATDQLALSDKGQPDSAPRDAVPLSDNVDLQSAVFHPLAASDTVALRDFTSLPRVVIEILQLGDAASLPSRLVSSVMDIVDTVVPVPGKGFLLNESLAVDAQMIVSVYWDRLLAEALDLADCTPFSCNQGLHFGDGLLVGDEFIPPPKHFETISATDSIARTAFFPRGEADPLAVTDRIAAAVTMAPPPPPPGSPAPPLSAKIVSDKNIVAPMPGADLTGTYSVNSDANQLVSQLNLPAMTITNAVAPSDLPAMTVVLPIYHVNLVPSPRLPGDDAMLTVKVAQIPAETPIMVPINIAATPQTADQEIPWMKIEYTPKVDSTNFALMVSMMDSPPEGAKPVNASFTPMFIDVKWAGSFSAATPDTGDYYRSLPTLTFAITEAWASQQNVQRDGNNVPIMLLNLFDESTGSWTEVSNIDMPAAIAGGQYVYVAHLDHFSTYVISASKAAHTSGSPSPPPALPAALAAQLADSITTTDAPSGKAVEVVEEFSKNKKVLVTLSDLIGVAVKPVAYETLQVGEDVTVDISLKQVEAEQGVLGRAVATLLLQMKNSGGAQEQFVLDYSYMGDDGRPAYQSSKSISLAPDESRDTELKIPFTKPGSYQLITEARSVDGETLAFAQIDVEVSWLEVNLYLVIAAAVAVLAGATVTMIMLVLKRTRASARGVS